MKQFSYHLLNFIYLIFFPEIDLRAMNAGKFLSLSLMDKIKVLYEKGNFVVAIRYYGYKVNLYLLANYYVEVFYNHKADKIERIDLLDYSHSRFKFYVDQINLPVNLMNNS